MSTPWGIKMNEFNEVPGPTVPPNLFLTGYDSSGHPVRVQFSVVSDAIVDEVDADPTAGIISSLLMQADDGTKHYVRLKRFGDDYHLVPDQEATTGDAITSFNMRADDDTDHMVVLRRIEGVYHIIPDQDPL